MNRRSRDRTKTGGGSALGVLDAARLQRAQDLIRGGALAQAESLLRDHAAAFPRDPVAHYNHGKVLRDLGRSDEALAAFQRAVRLDGRFADAHVNLGNVHYDAGRLREAEACQRRAVALAPESPIAHNNLAQVLLDLGRNDECLREARAALDLRPDFPEALVNMARAYLVAGRDADAGALVMQAASLEPRRKAHSNTLLLFHYLPGVAPQLVADAHRAWDRRHGRPLLPAAPHYATSCDPERRLRVGYVSPDFRQHSCAYFIEPLLAGHDPAAVETFCYADVPRPDDTTRRLRSLAHHWRSTVGLGDGAMAEAIRADGIDILVDLAGHTADNRLTVFARKPAPVQASWLGYPHPLSIGAIAYRLTDAAADPEGEADRLADETLIRLRDGFLCFQPPPSGEVAPLPCRTAETVTFASFNNSMKLNGPVVAAWAAILSAVPTARLLLKARHLDDRSVGGTLRQMFGAVGDRVEIVGATRSVADHLDGYGRVDIGLDPFPYNGTTTTCEAMWMGVPVVTLRGDRHAGRVGASLLGRLGLGELVADSVDDYVRIAIALAEDHDRLEALRASLRPRMAASPLCDGPGFARAMEDAFRAMWRRWCARQDAEM